VSGISTALQVAAGYVNSCAVLSGGGVDCWGDNASGELGDGSSTGSSTPVAVPGISTARQVSIFGYHACALLAGGSIACWGANSKGQLGDGTVTLRRSPVLVNLPINNSDTTAPAAPGSFTGVPLTQTASTTATIGFTLGEADGTVECKLDGGSWGSCTSVSGTTGSMALTGLALGAHSLSVRQTDAAGNVSDTGTSASWSVVVPTGLPRFG
jgi:hypothetical protein